MFDQTRNRIAKFSPLYKHASPPRKKRDDDPTYSELGYEDNWVCVPMARRVSIESSVVIVSGKVLTSEEKSRLEQVCDDDPVSGGEIPILFPTEYALSYIEVMFPERRNVALMINALLSGTDTSYEKLGDTGSTLSTNDDTWINNTMHWPFPSPAQVENEFGDMVTPEVAPIVIEYATEAEFDDELITANYSSGGIATLSGQGFAPRWYRRKKGGDTTEEFDYRLMTELAALPNLYYEIYEEQVEPIKAIRITFNARLGGEHLVMRFMTSLGNKLMEFATERSIAFVQEDEEEFALDANFGTIRRETETLWDADDLPLNLDSPLYVKNPNAYRTSFGTVLSVDASRHGWHEGITLSLDGVSWSESLELGDLGPEDVAGPIYVKWEVPKSTRLGIAAPRLKLTSERVE